MFFCNIKLPDELQLALADGRLVIFAGAGVSFPPPSNLKLFGELAAEIAGIKDPPPIRIDISGSWFARNRSTFTPPRLNSC